MLVSLLGEVQMASCHRLCRRCGQRFVSVATTQLTPKRLTPAAEQVASMAGVASNSFGEAADHVLRTMAGLRLSESTVQRTAE